MALEISPFENMSQRVVVTSDFLKDCAWTASLWKRWPYSKDLDGRQKTQVFW